MKILLVEEEIALDESIRSFLKKEGHVREWVKNNSNTEHHTIFLQF